MEIHMEYRKSILLRDEVGSSLEFEDYYATSFFCFFFLMFRNSARQNFLSLPRILGYTEEILDTSSAH